MNQYCRKEDTPLEFHNFFRFFSLPAGFLLSAAGLIRELSQPILLYWVSAIDIGFSIAMLTLMIVCFIGFLGWKSYAWYAVNIYLCLYAVYYLIALILYVRYLPEEIATAIGQLFGVLVYVIPVGIYYKKRRPLFFADAVPNTMLRSADSAECSRSTNDADPAVPEVKYCRACGYALMPKSVFCSNCGTKITAIIRDAAGSL